MNEILNPVWYFFLKPRKKLREIYDRESDIVYNS